MNYKPFFCLVAVLAALCATSRADAQYYNDDFITLPNGPIKLDYKVINFNPALNQWTLTADAVNLTSQTYVDVKYLDEWVFDYTPQPSGPAVTSAFVYQDPGTGSSPASDLWTAADGNTWSVFQPDGYIMASDVSPLPYADNPQLFTAPTAYVAPTDLLPYVNVGTIGPFDSVLFTQIINVSSDYDFAFDSSFISMTQPVMVVPEPSSLALFCLGLIGGVVSIRRRRRPVGRE